jgi:hypothetical protein
LGTYDGAGDSPFLVRISAQPSDCRWAATLTVPWVRVVYNSSSGTGDGTMYVSLVQWNPGPSTRVGEVVVSGLAGVNPEARLVVTQAGG